MDNTIYHMDRDSTNQTNEPFRSRMSSANKSAVSASWLYQPLGCISLFWLYQPACFFCFETWGKSLHQCGYGLTVMRRLLLIIRLDGHGEDSAIDDISLEHALRQLQTSLLWLADISLSQLVGCISLLSCLSLPVGCISLLAVSASWLYQPFWLYQPACWLYQPLLAASAGLLGVESFDHYSFRLRRHR